MFRAKMGLDGKRRPVRLIYSQCFGLLVQKLVQQSVVVDVFRSVRVETSQSYDTDKQGK